MTLQGLEYRSVSGYKTFPLRKERSPPFKKQANKICLKIALWPPLTD